MVWCVVSQGMWYGKLCGMVRCVVWCMVWYDVLYGMMCGTV